MIRTQVYLTEDLQRRISYQAKKENKPAAKIIRDAIEEGLNKKSRQTINAGQLLLEMAKKAVPSGDPNGSKNIDRDLYENI